MEVKGLYYDDNIHNVKLKLYKIRPQRPSYTRIYKDEELLNEDRPLLLHGIIQGTTLRAIETPSRGGEGSRTMKLFVEDIDGYKFHTFIQLILGKFIAWM